MILKFEILKALNPNKTEPGNRFRFFVILNPMALLYKMNNYFPYFLSIFACPVIGLFK